MRSYQVLFALGLALLMVAGWRVPPAGAQAAGKPGTEGEAAKLDPATIWPASLDRIAGRYVFAQVASPGGLWRTDEKERRQVSLRELSAPARERLEAAEILISELKLPTQKDASQRVSPSKRGNLRYYQEQATGKLVMRGLPGVGGADGDAGSYSGPVHFEITHASHSNPSVAGVFNVRQQQEQTWGAATLDYADLQATPILPEGKADAELPAVIGNARILRSGVEIFAFVGWTEKGAGGAEQTFRGAVRLLRQTGPGNVRPARPETMASAVSRLN